MRKLFFLFFFCFLIPSGVVFAVEPQGQIEPDSITVPDMPTMSTSVGVPGYPNALQYECGIDGTPACSDGDLLASFSLTGDYTILSYYLFAQPSSPSIVVSCGDYTLPGTEWFAEFFDYARLAQLAEFSNTAQVHCSGSLLTSPPGGVMYAYVQFVPYDTRVSSADDSPTYFDWLLFAGFVLFFLSLIVFYPIIKALFPHYNK